MQEQSPLQHPYPVVNGHLFGLFYEALYASDNFSYAGQRDDHGLEKGAIYSRYKPALNMEQLGLLDPMPKDMPHSLIWYRLYWHQHLSQSPAFLEQLAYKNVGHGRYFRDVERCLRACYELLVAPSAIPLLGHYKKTLHDAATRHAAGFAGAYFANASPQSLSSHLLSEQKLAVEDETMQASIRGINWAVSVGIPYAGALLGISLHPGQLTDSGWYQPERSIFSTEEINLANEAGYRMARLLMERLLPVRGHYQASDSELAAIMCGELCTMAQQQQSLLPHAGGMARVDMLVQDMHDNHEAALLYRMYELCQQSRIRQNLATQQMQQFLAHYFSEEEDPEARYRDQEQEQAPIQEQASEEAVDAGLVILEYFKNIQFGSKSEEQAVEAEHAETIADDDEESASNSGNKKSKVQFEIQDMEFEVSINGEETKRLKLTQIFNALRSGSSVRFASKAQARTFVNAVTKMAQQMGIDPGFNMTQISFTEKGNIQRITQEIIEDIQDELSRHHQHTALQLQWLQQQHGHEAKQQHGHGHGHGQHHQPHAEAAQQAHSSTGHSGKDSAGYSSGHEVRPGAPQHAAASDASPAHGSEQGKHSPEVKAEKPHAPEAGGEMAESAEHDPKAKAGIKTAMTAKHAAMRHAMSTDLLTDAQHITKPDAPDAKPETHKEIGR